MRSRASLFRAAAFLFLAVAACADRPAAPDLTDPVQATVRGDGDIIAVQNRHTPDLMRRDGIIGTGVRTTGAGAIVVYAVSPSHAASARVPRQLEGYDVEVVVTGRIDATDFNNPTTKERPAPIGFSVGHPSITAGTIGARVKDGAGNVYILSNNHVIANSNNATIGDLTLQPGPYDGGTSADRIGVLSAFETIVMGGASNIMDAAIAQVDDPADLLGITPDYAYGAPGTNTVNATVGMDVQKFGRTTGHTKGKVAEINVSVSVCYVPRGLFMCAEAATFHDQVAVEPGSFSAGGDSGSLIVTTSNNSPVALLFAGSSTRTLANPIGPVLNRFGVVIDPTNDGGSEPPVEPPPPEPGDDTTPPTASFTYACGNTATCSFTDTSTDNVGVTSWAWTFDTEGTSSQQNPSFTFTGAGSKSVTLIVSDAAGNTGSVSRTISCAVRGRNLRCS